MIEVQSTSVKYGTPDRSWSQWMHLFLRVAWDGGPNPVGNQF